MLNTMSIIVLSAWMATAVVPATQSADTDTHAHRVFEPRNPKQAKEKQKEDRKKEKEGKLIPHDQKQEQK
jgi:hypothetical protein